MKSEFDSDFSDSSAAAVQDKFSVFWYNDAEINRWNEQDFEAKAAEFAAAGVNIVMTFSCTHFRWSFYPYRATINAALKRLVDACHKYNIRVVEHHSSHLTFVPLHHRHWEVIERIITIRQGSLDMFPGLREHLAMGDPEIAPDVYLSDCRQIDGRTGMGVYSPYCGYAHCFNNPHFRKAFFATLEDVYATGVDGIMTDDVQYYGSGHACTCKYCREKFKAESGYDLPQPSEWGRFFGDYENPAFVEFLRFRIRSAEAFHRAVNEHFTGLGLKLLRPNYCTSTFCCNITGHAFEEAADLWTSVFQENMVSLIIQTAWLGWTEDAVQRSSMGRKYNIDSMSMFYPSSYDNYYFSWALTRAWEHLLMATPEGGDLNDVELKFAEYEKTHRRWVRAADPMAEIAFLEPRSSMDCTADPAEASTRPFRVWMQAALLGNRRMAMLFESDTLDEWLKYPAVAVAGATMLSDEQLELMKRYCEAGGKLFIFGRFGRLRPDGSLREHPEKIFGFSADYQELASGAAGELELNGQTLTLEAVTETCILTDLAGEHQVTARSADGKVYGVSAMNGNLLFMAGGVTARGASATQNGVIVSHWDKDPDREVPAPAYAVDNLKRVPSRVLDIFLNTVPQVQIDSGDYLVSAYWNKLENRFGIHLVNVADVLQKPPATVSHSFTFRNFTENAEAVNAALEVKFKLPEGVAVSQAIACSPEFAEDIALEHQVNDRIAVINIPAGTFAGYLNIILK